MKTGHRASFVERIFSFILLGGYLTFVIPYYHPSTIFAGMTIAITISVVAFSFGRFFSGEGGRRYLFLAASVLILSIILFASGLVS